MTNPLVAFLTALQSDPALKARLQEALPETADDVPARVKAFAAAEGYAVSDGDLAALTGALERQGPRDGDARVLSDSEVDEVSGGVFGATAAAIILTVARNYKMDTGNLGANFENHFKVDKRQFWIGF